MAAKAGRQHGRITWRQLRAIGVGRTTISRWRKGGYLHRLLPRVYAVGHPGRSAEADLSAALLYAGPGASLTGASALWWLALLPGEPPKEIQVSTPRRVQARPGITIRGDRFLPRQWHRGLPTVTPSQAILDFATRASLSRVKFVLANADYAGLLDVAELASLAGRGIPGSATLRRALHEHLPQLAETRSRPERKLLELCQRHRLPIPQVNVMLRGHLVDALWPEQRVIVEIDGYGNHRSRAQLRRDHRRDMELRARGFIVLRYTEDQLDNSPELVVADILRALARQAAA